MQVREITVEQLSTAIAEGRAPLLVDVRSEAEHALVHLEGATLLPLPELAERVDEIEEHRTQPIVVYCHHGIRSRTGAAILSAAGYVDVASLRGGIDAWSLRVDPKVTRY